MTELNDSMIRGLAARHLSREVDGLYVFEVRGSQAQTPYTVVDSRRPYATPVDKWGECPNLSVRLIFSGGRITSYLIS